MFLSPPTRHVWLENTEVNICVPGSPLPSRPFSPFTVLSAVCGKRKNYLFAGSDAGGHTAAVLYSIVAPWKQWGIDPFTYLRDVLARLPDNPPEQRTGLLPAAWAQTRRDQAANPT
jgi:hypothetical protein